MIYTKIAGVGIIPLYAGYSTPTTSGGFASNGALRPTNDPIPAFIRAASNEALPIPIASWFTNSASLPGMLPAADTLLGQGVQKPSVPPLCPYKSWGDWADNAFGLFSGQIERFYYKALPTSEKPVIHSNLVGSAMGKLQETRIYTPKADGTGYTQGSALKIARYRGFKVKKSATSSTYTVSPAVFVSSPLPYYGLLEKLESHNAYWASTIHGGYYHHGGSYTVSSTPLSISAAGSFVTSVKYTLTCGQAELGGWSTRVFEVSHDFSTPTSVNMRVWANVAVDHTVDMYKSDGTASSKCVSTWTLKSYTVSTSSYTEDVMYLVSNTVFSHESLGTPLLAAYGSPKTGPDIYEMFGYRGDGFTPKIEITQDLEIWFERNRHALSVTAYYAAMNAADTSMSLMGDSLFETFAELGDVAELFDFRHKAFAAFAKLKDWRRRPSSALMGFLDMLTSGFLIWSFGLNPLIGAGLELHEKLTKLADKIKMIVGHHTIHGSYFSPIPVMHDFTDFGELYVESRVKMRTYVSDVPWILALLQARALKLLPLFESWWALTTGSFLLDPLIGMSQKLKTVDDALVFIASTEVDYVVGSTRLFLIPHQSTWDYYNTIPILGPDRTFHQPAVTYFRRWESPMIPTATSNPWGFSEPEGFLPPQIVGSLVYQIVAGDHIDPERLAIRNHYRALKDEFRKGREWKVTHPTWRFRGHRMSKAWRNSPFVHPAR